MADRDNPEAEVIKFLEFENDTTLTKYMSRLKKLESNPLNLMDLEDCLKLLHDLKEESCTSYTQLLNYRFLCNFLNQ